jgi:hypothetical protein
LRGAKRPGASAKGTPSDLLLRALVGRRSSVVIEGSSIEVRPSVTDFPKIFRLKIRLRFGR